jgi:hypothetical protein
MGWAVIPNLGPLSPETLVPIVFLKRRMIPAIIWWSSPSEARRVGGSESGAVRELEEVCRLHGIGYASRVPNIGWALWSFAFATSFVAGLWLLFFINELHCA